MEQGRETEGVGQSNGVAMGDAPNAQASAEQAITTSGMEMAMEAWDQMTRLMLSLRLPVGLLHLLSLSEHVRFGAAVVTASVLAGVLGTVPVVAAPLAVTLIFWLHAIQREKLTRNQHFREALQEMQ